MVSPDEKTQEIIAILTALSQMSIVIKNIYSILYKDTAVPTARAILQENIKALKEINSKLEALDNLSNETDNKDHGTTKRNTA